MKKNKIITLVITLALCILFVSCDSFFTTSWGSWAKRDLKDTYSKQSIEDLVDLIDDPSVANDKESSKALLEELGDRDLSGLSTKDAEKVLNLVTSTTISMDTMTGALETAKSNGNNVDVANLLNSIEKVDTSAAVGLLNDTEVQANGDVTTIVLASVSVAAQAVKSAGADTTTLKDNVSAVFNGTKEPATAVTAILGSGASEAETKELTAALNAIKYLKTNRESEVKNTKIIGGSSLSDLLNK